MLTESKDLLADVELRVCSYGGVRCQTLYC